MILNDLNDFKWCWQSWELDQFFCNVWKFWRTSSFPNYEAVRYHKKQSSGALLTSDRQMYCLRRDSDVKAMETKAAWGAFAGRIKCMLPPPIDDWSWSNLIYLTSRVYVETQMCKHDNCIWFVWCWSTRLFQHWTGTQDCCARYTTQL